MQHKQGHLSPACARLPRSSVQHQDTSPAGKDAVITSSPHDGHIRQAEIQFSHPSTTMIQTKGIWGEVVREHQGLFKFKSSRALLWPGSARTAGPKGCSAGSCRLGPASLTLLLETPLNHLGSSKLTRQHIPKPTDFILPICSHFPSPATLEHL